MTLYGYSYKHMHVQYYLVYVVYTRTSPVRSRSGSSRIKDRKLETYMLRVYAALRYTRVSLYWVSSHISNFTFSFFFSPSPFFFFFFFISFSLLLITGRSRVRASRRVPAGSPEIWRCQGPGPVLHHAVRRLLQEGGSQNRLLRCPSTRGVYVCAFLLLLLLLLKRMAILKENVTAKCPPELIKFKFTPI